MIFREYQVRWLNFLSVMINESEQALYMISIVCVCYQRRTSYIVDQYQLVAVILYKKTSMVRLNQFKRHNV